MKKGLLIPALIALAPMVASAEVDHSGLYTGPTVQARIGFGGDELETVIYSNGDTQKIRTGNGVEFAAGWHVQPYRNSPFDLRAQVGYKYEGANADNANIRFDRISWELIPSWQLGKGFWLGAGLLMHSNIKLHNDGVNDINGNVVPDAKFKNAFGADFQLGWRWLALTYTKMNYKYDVTGQSFSADNVGLQFTYSFGWTCCRGSSPAPVVSSNRPYVAPESAPVFSPSVAASVPPPPTPTSPVETPVAAAVAPPVAPVVQAAVEEIKPAAPRVTKATAVILHKAALRSRPTTSSTGDVIAAETRVRLESSIKNGDGTWWYVTAPGVGGGWLLESEIGSPQN